MTNHTDLMPKKTIAAAKWLFNETIAVYEETNHDRAHTDYIFATTHSAARSCFTATEQEAFIVDIASRIQESRNPNSAGDLLNNPIDLEERKARRIPILPRTAQMPSLGG